MGPMGPNEPRRTTKGPKWENKKREGIKGKSFPLNPVLHVRPPNNRPLRNRDRNRKFKAPKTNRPLISSKDDKTNLFFSVAALVMACTGILES